MNCPKCSAALDNVQLFGLRLSRCSGCKGIWCGEVDLLCLQAIRGAEMLDIGLPEVGREFNHVSQPICPHCVDQVLSTEPVDGHEHVKGEHCHHCHGWFLDAGELAELCSQGWLSATRAFFARRTTATMN